MGESATKDSRAGGGSIADGGPSVEVGSARVARRRVAVAGVALDPLTEWQVVDRVAAALEAGRGGHIVTPNTDICRAVAKDRALGELVGSAEVAVADGMPLVWACRLLGTPLPQRVTGADLIWSLCKMAARRGFTVYLLGGPPGVARRAAEELTSWHPRLTICGTDAPPYGFETTPEGLAPVRRRLVAARPRIVFVGLGFPKQDKLIAELRPDLPGTWFVGCGSAIAFAAGVVPRAPAWMREAGIEWAFRLVSEPSRLARRYLVDDLPFALRLMTICAVKRLVRGPS